MTDKKNSRSSSSSSSNNNNISRQRGRVRLKKLGAGQQEVAIFRQIAANSRQQKY